MAWLVAWPLIASPGIAMSASCSGGGGHTDFHAPALVEFTARDVRAGAGLTLWLPANGGASTGEFRCDSNASIDYRMETHGGFIRERYHESGAEYVVYETGVAGGGAAWRSWRNLNAAPADAHQQWATTRWCCMQATAPPGR